MEILYTANIGKFFAYSVFYITQFASLKKLQWP